MNHQWLVVNGDIADWPEDEIKVVKDDLLDPSQFRIEMSSLRSTVEYHCRCLLVSLKNYLQKSPFYIDTTMG